MKIFKFLLFFLAIFFIFPGTAFAQSSQNDVVLVNPIRGEDFWNKNFSLTQTPKKQYEIIKQNTLPSTWLVRYDALANPEVQEFLKSLDLNQDIGIFFEVTPALTKDAGVKYNQSENWHLAKSVLLTGYSPEDRKKLIDTAFGKFEEVLGESPKSVGAWWIDADSLSYMKEKYDIEANLDVADQYSTDGYQVWGQYWSTPFYPSKVSGLMPAQSDGQKLGVVTMQWATRDPYNGYGNGVFESTYSVQANDYILHDLGTDYFEKLLKIYPQTTVGLENDFDWGEFGEEFSNQIETISRLENGGEVQVFNMAEFANEYLEKNPGISPQVLISADDPLGSSGKAVWYMSPKYRAGLFFTPNGVIIRDLRFYNDSSKEECFDKSCEQLKLAFSQSSAIDEGNFNSKWILDEAPASDIKVNKNGENIEITYKTPAGIDKSITFLPNDIKVNDKFYTIESAIINALNSQPANIDEGNFESSLNIPETAKTLIPEVFKFIVLVFLFFLLPGLLFSNRASLAIPIGMVLMTLLAFILGYLGNLSPIFKSPFWFWVLPISAVIFKNTNIISYFKNFNFKISLNSLPVILLILLGSVIWSLTSIKNGLMFNYGFGFWGPNGHDIVWHLSLISELQKNIPPQNPIFSGQALTNYHYFYDLLIAKSAQVLNIDILDLVFRFFPLLLALLLGALIYTLTLKISNSKTASLWSVFFLYFGGSFGWIISYFRDGNFGGETMFWAQQSISALLNPPFVLSLVLLFAGLNIYYGLKKEKNTLAIFSIILLFGTLIEFKAYAGILILASLALISIEKIFRKDFRDLKIFVGSLVLSLVVFLPNNSGSEGLIEFMPLWLVSTMITSQDRLNWYRLTLTLNSGVPLKIYYANALGILIFILGNFGTRLIGLLSFKEIFKERILSWMLIFSIILPLLFIQKGNSWNIVQFFYYGLFIMGIFAGISAGKIGKKVPKAVGLILGIILVLLTIPTTLNTLTHFLPERPPAKLAPEEVEALKFLRTQENGTVLSMPYDEKIKSNFQTPLPLFAYAPTAYVSGFSGQRGFIEDNINLEILGIDPKVKINIAREIFRNKQKAKVLLTENNIDYVYLPKDLKVEIDETLMGLETIYENSGVKIYKVKT